MLKVRHIGRYTELLRLLTRYGLKDFKLQLSLDAALESSLVEEEATMAGSVRARAKEFAEALKRMGPTYVKFGQVLSTRPDIVPAEYVEALEELQDQVEPFSFAEVEKIVETELNVRISKVFETFEAQPIAAASLGQAHKAVLRDGREVVVKVQRPDILPRIQEDLDVFTEIAQVLERHSDVARKMNLIATVRQARWTLLAELNYEQEARNMDMLGRNLAEFERIYVPRVIADLSTSKILTTELIHGTKVSKLTPLAYIEHDYADLAAVLTQAYLKQICVDGFWHSDPHPGNVFIREEQLVLLDFGMTSRISGDFQDEIIKLMLGMSTNRSQLVAEACLRMGTAQEGFDERRFSQDIAQIVSHYYDADLKKINVGQMLFQVIGIANVNEVQVPSELALLAKTLLHLDGITKKLDPDYDAQQVIRDYMENLVARKVQQKFHPRNFYNALLEMNQLAVEAPGRAREILDKAARGKLALHVQMDQLEHLMKGVTKVANRITVGLIIAALLVASALMMRVPTRYVLFGYPLLSVLGYLVALGIGLYLVLTILLSDRRDQRRIRKTK